MSGPHSEKVRKDIVENILKELLSKLEDKNRLYPRSPFWEIIKGQYVDWTMNFPNALTQVADLICQKKANFFQYPDLAYFEVSTYLKVQNQSRVNKFKKRLLLDHFESIYLNNEYFISIDFIKQ